MARGRSGGGTGVAFALAALAGLALVFLVLSVVFYTQVADAQAEADTATNKLSQYVQRNEEGLPEVANLLQARGTVVGGLLDQNQKLIGMVSPDANYDSIISLREGDNAEFSGPSLFVMIRDLRQRVQNGENTIASLNSDLQAAQGRVTQLAQQKSELERSYDDAVAELNRRVGEQSETYTDFRDNSESGFGQIETRLNQTRAQLETRLNEVERERNLLASRVKNLEQELQRSLRSDGDLVGVPTTPADGLVAEIANDGSVFIDIGRDQYVTLGMTFEVFAADDLIKLEVDDQGGFADLRGKATLEVFNLTDTAAQTRVVRQTRGRKIASGDKVANIAYDPNITFKFMVFGDFDLDNSGDPSPTDKDRVEGLVRQFGGELIEELNFDVDYLVLGKLPAPPQPLAANEIDPVKIQAFVNAQREFETYRSLEQQAREFKIPILNQNRFLSVVGYYTR